MAVCQKRLCAAQGPLKGLYWFHSCSVCTPLSLGTTQSCHPQKFSQWSCHQRQAGGVCGLCGGEHCWVVQAQLSTAEHWQDNGGGLQNAAKKLNKLIKKASSVIGVQLDLLEMVCEQRTLSKLLAIMSNTHLFQRREALSLTDWYTCAVLWSVMLNHSYMLQYRLHNEKPNSTNLPLPI